MLQLNHWIFYGNYYSHPRVSYCPDCQHSSIYMSTNTVVVFLGDITSVMVARVWDTCLRVPKTRLQQSDMVPQEDRLSTLISVSGLCSTIITQCLVASHHKNVQSCDPETTALAQGLSRSAGLVGASWTPWYYTIMLHLFTNTLVLDVYWSGKWNVRISKTPITDSI